MRVSQYVAHHLTCDPNLALSVPKPVSTQRMAVHWEPVNSVSVGEPRRRDFQVLRLSPWSEWVNNTPSLLFRAFLAPDDSLLCVYPPQQDEILSRQENEIVGCKTPYASYCLECMIIDFI